MMLKLKIKLMILSLTILTLTNCTQSENSYESSSDAVQNEEKEGDDKAIRIIHDDEDVSDNQEVNNDNTDTDNFDDLPSTDGLEELAIATGDLDKDKVAEKVVVYDTKREIEMGTEREIHIYKKKNGNWRLWHKSIGAVLPSEHGGMMGDPFESLSIERGAIVIKHFGGSRQKWNYTHRFRYQKSSWELIGTTINYGSPCDYFEDFDYNLSTGKYIYTKEVQECEGDNPKTTDKSNKEARKKLSRLPKMDGFYPGDNQFVISDGVEMYY